MVLDCGDGALGIPVDGVGLAFVSEDESLVLLFCLDFGAGVQGLELLSGQVGELVVAQVEAASQHAVVSDDLLVVGLVDGESVVPLVGPVLLSVFGLPGDPLFSQWVLGGSGFDSLVLHGFVV